MLKNKLWTKRIHMEAKEKITLLKEIQKNNIREQKVLKELEKDDRQAQKNNRVVYIERRIYIANNQKI